MKLFIKALKEKKRLKRQLTRQLQANIRFLLSQCVFPVPRPNISWP